MPEKAVVTLTRVIASGNLQQAKVYISVMPDEKAPEALKILGQNVFDIQQILNEKLKMRPVPKILWVLEKATAEAQRIEEILDQIRKARERSLFYNLYDIIAVYSIPTQYGC
jgi:ribosome-binding factor A